ncbi:helix-turn-helix domain-containing protein [Enterobacteriaceae bacterium H20N1]|uniref:Helix-turn-helix domain-containing protein n=1 Tax=Dryocola boscaweniae TaxID=2925397 RepID=A0A9X2W3F8_9ENTR|nr:helix-turn-helix transcriptional regulator [Dryocola boscaweniae]MCT4700283.1 helix-turn-helix domain-containing protein [Dryocola boscaweniae]MCT4714504.1 helix-turn-helix domain-containing protein [Dryocola boscaweniae]MCT4717511.1 helix-turn-helix domain-containing protein [Dryocola boscaweniae]
MTFGKRLAVLRKGRKMTQAVLAEKSGSHISMIRRYESDEVQPTLEVIRNLSLALSVSADVLVFAEAERNPDRELQLLFEAVNQFTQEEKAVARILIEALILRHDANRKAKKAEDQH